MAKSKNLQLNKKRAIDAAGKLSPAERLEISLQLSSLCIELKKAGEKAKSELNRKS